MDNPGGAIGELPDRPGTTNQLKKLGDAIRDDDAVTYGNLHYNEVWSWCNDLVAAAVRDISDLDLGRLIPGGTPVSITGRAKIRATVREKLLRRRSEKLPSIQDLVGVRVEADMTLTEQDSLAEAIRRRFGQRPDTIHDLRDGAHAGYRAVHVWVRLDAPRGAWFEVQVRTRLQGGWANLYEALADAAGRGIRYGEPVEVPAFERLVKSVERSSLDVIGGLERLLDDAPEHFVQSQLVHSELVRELKMIGFQRAPARRIVRAALESVRTDRTTVRSVLVHYVSSNMAQLEAELRSLSVLKGG